MNVTELLEVAVAAFAGVVLPVGVLCLKAARWFDHLGDQVDHMAQVAEGHAEKLEEHERRITVLEATKET